MYLMCASAMHTEGYTPGLKEMIWGWRATIVYLDLPLWEACANEVNYIMCLLLGMQHSGRA